MFVAICTIYFDSSEGIDLMMSESPGSVMLNTETRKYLPQAVPNSMLFPE